MIENQRYGGQKRVSRAELEKAWVSGELRFELNGPNISQTLTSSIATNYTFDDFQTLPSKYQQEAWRRYQLLLPLLKSLDLRPDQEAYKSLDLSIDEYLKSVQNLSALKDSGQPVTVYLAEELALPARPHRTRGPIGEALNRASLHRWVYSFRKSGWDIRSLVPHR